jgi:hypothetical protein
MNLLFTWNKIVEKNKYLNVKMNLYQLRRKSQVKKEKLWDEKRSSIDLHLLRRYKKGIIYRYTSIAQIDIRVNTFCNYLIDTYVI